MSFLGDLIKKIVNAASNGESVAGQIHDFKAEIEERLIILYQSQDLRIFDGVNGGALRGPIKSRHKYEINHNNKQLICCDPRNIVDNKIEVPYSRALFNSRYLGFYHLISYEAPLMRKLTKDTNPEISSRQISCDLVGMYKNEICCIEVKVQPFTEACRPTYALLEGLAYCICLNWLLRINPLDVSQEINLCCKSFGVKASNLPGKVTFAVAGPINDYFMPYWQMKGQSEEWFKRRKREIESIEEVILSEYEQYFSGYLAIATPSKTIKTQSIGTDENCVIPLVPNSSIDGQPDASPRQPFVKRFKTFFKEL